MDCSYSVRSQVYINDVIHVDERKERERKQCMEANTVTEIETECMRVYRIPLLGSIPFYHNVYRRWMLDLIMIML